MKSIFLLFFLICIGFQDAASQNETTIIQFGAGEEREKAGLFDFSVIKTSPTSPFFGIGLIELEKRITPSLSLQFGGGVTYHKLIRVFEKAWFTFGELADEDFFDSDWPQDIEDEYDKDITRTKLGSMFSFSFRWFPQSSCLEGMYLAPTFDYRRLNYEKQSVVPGKRSIIRDPKIYDKEYYNQYIVGLRGGQQWLYVYSSIDLFISVGAIFYNGKRQDVGTDSRGIVRSVLRDHTFTSIHAEMGFRIGMML